MANIRLGKTEIITEKNAFGALPIQRVTPEVATVILRKAYQNGISFFDSAVSYSDSEYKLGLALGDYEVDGVKENIREKIIIATKTPAKNAVDFWKDLEKSLTRLKTDYIDIYQFHNPAFVPKPEDGTGLYEAMLEAKAMGKIRHIGITNHRLPVAIEAVESGLYETLQFPFSYLSGEKDEALVALCKEKDVGFICMKALSGGLITHSDAAYAYLNQFDNVLPIWGIQKESELDEFISYIASPAVLDDKMKAFIEEEKKELSGSFCRGCGYCMPCPQGIEINACARMSLLLQRSRTGNLVSKEGQERMEKVNNCTNCGACRTKCPYELDPPTMLKENYKFYKEYIANLEENQTYN